VSAVPVRLGPLEAGDFPPVCVKTGAPSNLRITTTLSITPGWIWALLLCGIAPFFLAQIFATEKVPVRLPVSERAWARARSANRITLGLLVAIGLAVIGVVVIPALRIEAMGWLIGILIVAEIVAVVMWNWQWVGLAHGSHRGEVYLTRVHPDFAFAYGKYLGEHGGDSS
jgi:hypothetical protein